MFEKRRTFFICFKYKYLIKDVQHREYNKILFISNNYTVCETET